MIFVCSECGMEYVNDPDDCEVCGSSNIEEMPNESNDNP